MAEIDNSLAARIQVPQIDVLNPLMKAAQYRNLQAETGLKEQELGHRQFLYNQGGGYDPNELHTRATTANVLSDLRGRAGNILANDQSPAARQLAIQTVKMHGVPVHPDMERAIMTGPAGEVAQLGKNMEQGGQPAGQSIEQNPGQIYKRAQAGTAGGLQGQLTAPPGSGPAPSAQPNQSGQPKPPLVQQVETAKRRGEQAPAELANYQKEADQAGYRVAGLRQMLSDAARVRTGAGADKEQAARKVIVALGQLVPGLEEHTSKMADKAAAFESLDKNAGIVARAMTKEVGIEAASGLDAISKSLVSGSTTNKGIDVNAHQLIGFEHFKQARSAAAQQWSNERGGDMNGFATDFGRKAGVGAWMFRSLPEEEQRAVVENLNKTKEGKSVISGLTRQLDYIRKSGLEEGVY